MQDQNPLHIEKADPAAPPNPRLGEISSRRMFKDLDLSIRTIKAVILELETVLEMKDKEVEISKGARPLALTTEKIQEIATKYHELWLSDIIETVTGAMEQAIREALDLQANPKAPR